FISSSVGFVSGEDGIWKSTDGGANWTNITPSGASLPRSTSHWFINANVGVFGLGNCHDSVVTFYRTTNGGTSWNTVTYTYGPTAPDSTSDAAVGGITYIGTTFYCAGGYGNFWYSN